MSIESIIFLALFLLLPLIERVLQGQRNRRTPPPPAQPRPRPQGTPGRLPGEPPRQWQTTPDARAPRRDGPRPSPRQRGAPEEVHAPHPDYSDAPMPGPVPGHGDPSAGTPDLRVGHDTEGRPIAIEERPATARRRNPNQRRRPRPRHEPAGQGRVRSPAPLGHPGAMRAHLRHPETYRRAVVLAAVLNPCRANDPYQV